MKAEHFVWTEKYRPKTLDDCILPTELKKYFQSFKDAGNLPNLILYGGPGTGKTTTAMAILNDIGCNYQKINASMHGNIDTLRTEIHNYAMTVSLVGGRKYVILDEADHLNSSTTQPALRAFMEEFAKSCGFILTANFPEKIIEPLRSRCTELHFNLGKKDLKTLGPVYARKLVQVLNIEKVEFEEKALIAYVMKKFPDLRNTLGSLQTYAMKNGKIDSGILAKEISDIDPLIQAIKTKNYDDATKWVLSSDIEGAQLYQALFDNRQNIVKNTAIPEFIAILADFQYKDSFVANKAINTLAMIATLMATVV